MADRKAINKYYPPGWDPSKGSINKYQKSHPLRDRARRLDQGILVVRFGLPFNIWCSQCENHVGQGVRYNAEKTRAGSYYDTPIYEFKMKCKLCDNHYVLRTDPANLDYCIVSGARRQARQEFLDEVDQSEAAKLIEETERQVEDPMLRLEKKTERKVKADASEPSLIDLKKWRSRWEDSFSMNQLVRSHFRERRRKIDQSRERDKRLLKKTSLKISLCTPTQSIRQEARRVLRGAHADKAHSSEAKRKSDLVQTSQFISQSIKIKLRDSPTAGPSRSIAPRIKKEM